MVELRTTHTYVMTYNDVTTTVQLKNDKIMEQNDDKRDISTEENIIGLD